MSDWRAIDADQNLRLAQKMLEQQGQINALKAERDALKATVEQVRRLQELTIATSCRMHAIHQAEDTLRILDTPASAPESPATAPTPSQATREPHHTPGGDA